MHIRRTIIGGVASLGLLGAMALGMGGGGVAQAAPKLAIAASASSAKSAGMLFRAGPKTKVVHTASYTCWDNEAMYSVNNNEYISVHNASPYILVADSSAAWYYWDVCQNESPGAITGETYIESITLGKYVNYGAACSAPVEANATSAVLFNYENYVPGTRVQTNYDCSGTDTLWATGSASGSWVTTTVTPTFFVSSW